MAQDENAITIRNQEQSPLLRLPAELRNMIYQHAIGNNFIVVINNRYLQHSMQRTAVLLQVCRQLYHETMPLVVGINVVSGYGRRMAKVLRRLADSTHANYIKRIRITLDMNSIAIHPPHKSGQSVTVHLCQSLVSLVDTLRGLPALEHVAIHCPRRWGADTNEALRAKMERALHAGGLARQIEVEALVRD